MSGEPSHDDLCGREQRYVRKAIEDDIDLSEHMNDGAESLKIVPADARAHARKLVAGLHQCRS